MTITRKAGYSKSASILDRHSPPVKAKLTGFSHDFRPIPGPHARSPRPSTRRRYALGGGGMGGTGGGTSVAPPGPIIPFSCVTFTR